MLLNNGILLNGVLRPKLLNIYSASCSFITFDFSLPHTAHFDDNIVLPVLVFNTLGSTFFVFFFSQLKQLINNDDGNIFLTAYFKAFVLLNDLTEILILIVFLKSCLLIIF